MGKVCVVANKNVNFLLIGVEKIELDSIQAFACVKRTFNDEVQVEGEYVIWLKTNGVENPWNCIIDNINFEPKMYMDDPEYCMYKTKAHGFKTRKEVTDVIDKVIKGELQVLWISGLDYDYFIDANNFDIEPLSFNENGVLLESDIPVTKNIAGIYLHGNDIKTIELEDIDNTPGKKLITVCPYFDTRYYRIKSLTDNTHYLYTSFAERLFKRLVSGEYGAVINNNGEMYQMCDGDIKRFNMDIYIPIKLVYDHDIDILKSRNLILDKSEIKQFKLMHHKTDGCNLAFAKTIDDNKVLILENKVAEPIRFFSSKADLAYDIDLLMKEEKYLLKVTPFFMNNNPYDFAEYLSEFTLSSYILNPLVDKRDRDITEKKLTLNDIQTKPSPFKDKPRLTHNDIEDMFTKDRNDDICELYFTMKNDLNKKKYRICTPKDLTFETIEKDIQKLFNDELDLIQKDDNTYKFTIALREPVYTKLDLSKYKKK